MRKSLLIILVLVLSIQVVRPQYTGGMPTHDIAYYVQRAFDFVNKGGYFGEILTHTQNTILVVGLFGGKIEKWLEYYEKVENVAMIAKEVLILIQNTKYILQEMTWLVTHYTSSQGLLYTIQEVKYNTQYLLSLVTQVIKNADRIYEITGLKDLDILKIKKIRQENKAVQKLCTTLGQMRTTAQILQGNHGMVESLMNNQIQLYSPRKSTPLTSQSIPGMIMLSESQLQSLAAGRRINTTNKNNAFIFSDGGVDDMGANSKSPITMLMPWFYAISALAGLFGAYKVYLNVMLNGGVGLGKEIAIWVSITTALIMFSWIIQSLF